MNPDSRVKWDRHPMRRMTALETMNWLDDRGWISNLCVQPEDVAPQDVERIEAKFKERWCDK